MLFGKKQRALEGERDKYKAEVERLTVELIDARTTHRALTNPPEGCRVGNWCQGCKYADSRYIPDYGYERIRACLYGACDKRESVNPVSFTGCV